MTRNLMPPLRAGCQRLHALVQKLLAIMSLNPTTCPACGRERASRTARQALGIIHIAAVFQAPSAVREAQDAYVLARDRAEDLRVAFGREPTHETRMALDEALEQQDAAFLRLHQLGAAPSGP